jgi:hypothetical protein
MFFFCCAVHRQDRNKEMYFERTIQTLEQQLLALQQGLNDEAREDDASSEIEPYAASKDDDSDELAVAEYIRRCRYEGDSIYGVLLFGALSHLALVRST